MPDDHSDLVQRHFERSYQDYDRLIPTLVPGYCELKASVLASIDRGPSTPFDVLDLGCGTAALGAEILSRWPESTYTGIDLSRVMIEQARQRLRPFGGHVRLLQTDFFKLKDLQIAPAEVVISALAIHHFINKREVYQLVCSQLILGGSFILADLVVDPQLDHKAYEFRRGHMLSAGLSQKEIGDWFALFNAEDRPSTIEENLQYLKEAGFTPRVVWHNPSYATFHCTKRG